MTMMRKVLGHSQFAVEPRMLKHHAQPPPHPGRLARQIVPEDPRAARLNRRQGREQLEQRALAAAIGSQKCENLAARNRETHVRKRLAVAIAKAERARLNRRRSSASGIVSKLWMIRNCRSAHGHRLEVIIIRREARRKREASDEIGSNC